MSLNRPLQSVAFGIFLASSAAPAAAVDGCEVLLCLAGNWQNISQCVPPVQQVLRDLARGKPFPSCAMSGSGNGATHSWASEATCPPMYSSYHPDTGVWNGCAYAGSFDVTINSAHWSTVFWSTGGNSSTRYSDDARQQLGATIDPTFDRDLATWEAAHPPAPPCAGENC